MAKLKRGDYSGPETPLSQYLCLRNEALETNPRSTEWYKDLCCQKVGLGSEPDRSRCAHFQHEPDFELTRWVVRRGSGCFWVQDTPRTTVRGFKHHLVTRGAPVRVPLHRLSRADTEWIEIQDPQILHDIESCFDNGPVHRTDYLPDRLSVRITIAMEDHTHIRFISPHNIWDIKVYDWKGEHTHERWSDPNPCPPRILPALYRLFSKHIGPVKARLDTSIHLLHEVQRHLDQPGETPKANLGIRTSYCTHHENVVPGGGEQELFTKYGGTLRRTNPVSCALCDDKYHQAEWEIHSITKRIKLTCPKTKPVKQINPSRDLIDHLFSHTETKRARTTVEAVHTTGQQADGPHESDATHDAFSHPSPPTTEGVRRPDTLTVIQYNTDKGSNSAAGSIIRYVHRTNADIMCLQEVENERWSDTFLQKEGYSIYRHGKVAILIRICTLRSRPSPHPYGEADTTIRWA